MMHLFDVKSIFKEALLCERLKELDASNEGTLRYSIPLVAAAQRNARWDEDMPTGIEVLGTGFVVREKGRDLLFSAWHVIQEAAAGHGDGMLYYPDRDGKFTPLPNGAAVFNDDKDDIASVEIEPDSLGAIFQPVDKSHFLEPQYVPNPNFISIYGFPAFLNRTSYGEVAFAGLGYTTNTNVDTSNSQVSFKWDSERLVDEMGNPLPGNSMPDQPRGCSGAPIWLHSYKDGVILPPKICGIFIEHDATTNTGRGSLFLANNIKNDWLTRLE